jgi:hypothetical protein
MLNRTDTTPTLFIFLKRSTMLRKSIPALLLAILSSSSPLLAQGVTPIFIHDFVTGVNRVGSFVERPDEALDLYDENGKLIETLRFFRKLRKVAASGTISTYESESYIAHINSDAPSEGSYAVAKKFLPGKPLDPKQSLSKAKALQIWTDAAERAKQAGDQESYQDFLEAIKKVKALPD